MNKYFVNIGEYNFERWGAQYIAYSEKSSDELSEDPKFLDSVDEEISNLYYEFADDGEDYDEFIESGGLLEIRPYKNSDGKLEILYDEQIY